MKGEKCFSIPALLTIIIPLHAPAVKEPQLTAGTERRRKAPPRPGAPAVKEPQLTAVTERRRIASAPRRLRGERDAVNRRDGETQCNCFRAYTVIKM